MNRFASVKEASDHFGVAPQTIYYRMRKGELFDIWDETPYKNRLLKKTGMDLEKLLSKLYEMYCVQFLTQREIAKKLGTTQATISNYIRKYRIVYRLDLAT